LRREPARDAMVALGLEIAEREILELPLELPDAEPVRERRIHLARLERETFALLGRSALHLAHPRELRGEPHEQQPRIAEDREQHLAQRFDLLARRRTARLPRLSAERVDADQLGRHAHGLRAEVAAGGFFV